LADDPNLKVTEISKEIGIRWKLLEDEEKVPYNERVELEKMQYVVKVSQC
jgi:hypothetical protein